MLKKLLVEKGKQAHGTTWLNQSQMRTPMPCLPFSPRCGCLCSDSQTVLVLELFMFFKFC